MKKLILCACLTVLTTCRVLTAYAEHQHTYSEANCESAAVCSECGETIQEPLGHTSSVGVCLRCGNVQNEDLVNTLNTFFAEIMDIGNNLISCVSGIADLDDDTQYNKFQIADGYVSDMKNLYSSIIASCKNISELDGLVYQITLLQNSCPDAIQGNDTTSLANQTFLYQLYLQQISSSFNYFSEYMDYLAGNRDLPEGTKYFEKVKTMPTPDSIISGITFDSSSETQYTYLIGDNEDDANFIYNIYLSALELADDLKVDTGDNFSYVEKDGTMVCLIDYGMGIGTAASKEYFLTVTFHQAQADSYKNYEDYYKVVDGEIVITRPNDKLATIEGVLFNKDEKRLLLYPEDNTQTSYSIPNGITSIGDGAFNNCRNLTSITIPDSVTSIGTGAFSNCYSLNTIILENNKFEIIDGVLFDNDKKELLCYLRTNSKTSYDIPDDVTSISDSAFYNCPNLTTITIPDSVTSIGNSAFSDCSNLTTITIPDSVTSIGYSAFSDCSNLISITIPDSVTSISNDAFSDCSNLISITIPDSVTSIGYSAFSNCSNLTTITIPDSVTSINSYAFSDCSNLISITIPDSVTSIGYSVFSDCSNLTTITIPDSVTSIGDYAFDGCDNLIIETTNSYVKEYALNYGIHCKEPDDISWLID